MLFRSPLQRIVCERILHEIEERLKFLVDVGLHYLSLDRPSASLAGGEAQRIRLATQIGSQLMGVLYILDEPSIGLHQRDNRRLLDTLLRMRDIGNTVVVVEHDEETIRAADYVIDLGRGPGLRGARSSTRVRRRVSSDAENRSRARIFRVENASRFPPSGAGPAAVSRSSARGKTICGVSTSNCHWGC
mgnify:CR=1 FL=1